MIRNKFVLRSDEQHDRAVCKKNKFSKINLIPSSALDEHETLDRRVANSARVPILVVDFDLYIIAIQDCNQASLENSARSKVNF
jgi:hypothetical protein